MATSSIPQSSGIYKIVCLPTGKIYIGSSNNLFHRKITHWAELRGGYHINRYLQNAWNKYGEQSFTFEIIEIVMSFILLDREQYWLDKLTPYGEYGFNLNKIAAIPPSRKGCVLTDEHRSNIGKGLKGKKNALGKKHRPEAYLNKSKAMMGHSVSDHCREMCSITHAKTYMITTPDGKETIITNLRRFCRENDLSYSSMTEVVYGKRTSCNGWKCRKP